MGRRGRAATTLSPGRPYAEETQRSIDQEVAGLLREAEVRATKLLRDNRGALNRVIDLLLERETIDGAELDAITAGPTRAPEPELVLSHRAVKTTPRVGGMGGGGPL